MATAVPSVPPSVLPSVLPSAPPSVPWSVPFTRDPRVQVRRATPDDVVELAALKRRVERRCYAHLASDAALSVRLHRRGTAWWLLNRLAAGDLLLLAQLEGRTIGLAGARLDRPGAGAARLHLHSSYVEDEGHGAGTALLAARLEVADALGVATVTADAFVGCLPIEARLRRLGMNPVTRPTESPTFPGVPLSHWAGRVHTALRRLDRRI